MVFTSSTFLFAFLPIALAVYFIVPVRAFRNVWLLVVSLVFYAWGEPMYVFLMIASIFANWIFGLLVGSENADDNPIRRKAVLVVAVCFNVAVIGFFKYEGFLAENINGLVGAQIVPNLNLPLPIGISFYTLQALSYVIDVYRHDVPRQRNVLYLGMYIACFPQLIAGPIVRYQTIQEQVLNRKENLSDFASGMRLFSVGLAKKVLLANVCAILADKMLGLGGASIGLVGAWGGIVAYTFQIFFDFSGYSDMAIGLGRMMGFKYLRNFNYPYIAKSIAEFWRRWHISLYTFFRDYIYIPLGGSRVSTGRWVLNTAIVWAITGMWHGAAWNYILWGVYYGVILICEKLVWGKALEKLPAIIRHLYAILLFMFGWVLFWITDMTQIPAYLQALVGVYGISGTSTVWELTVWEYLPVFVCCAVASTPIVPWLRGVLFSWAEGNPRKSVIADDIANPRAIQADTLCAHECVPITPQRAVVVRVVLVCVDIALLALMVASFASVLSGSYNPFIYFQF